MSDMQWRFDNSYARLPEDFFVRMAPTPVAGPKTVLLNEVLARELGLDVAALSRDATPVFAGNAVPEGAEPLAQAYAGHQFGHFTMLGDGRAIVLGEHLAPDGRRFDVQLKGSGRTPFSRSGDGRAALGPMLREYIVSEAMHALGIPTTRSLAVVATGEAVLREDVLPGAILTRVAASHLRVGTFEYAAALREPGRLESLVRYALERHYPGLVAAPNPALALLEAVMGRQAALVAQWMRVGFVHGVMNTDNVAISGETIDYGPCAFLDAYDPATVFSSIDQRGRYAFANQPAIAQWNLARFAEALLTMIDPDPRLAVELAEERVRAFGEIFRLEHLAMMRRKLGLLGEEPGDGALAGDLTDWMHKAGADYTATFRALGEAETPSGGRFDEPAFRDWHGRWRDRVSRQDKPPAMSRALMDSANPVYIPRNHKVEEAIEAATGDGDLAPVNALLEVLARPYERRDGFDAYELPPEPGGARYRTFCGT